MWWKMTSAYVTTCLCLLAGCGSPDLDSQGTAVKVTQEPAETEKHQATDEGSQDDASILNRAAQILDRAKQSGSSQAGVASEWLSERMQDVSESTSQAADNTGEWATDTFQYLKEQGLTTANSTQEWLSEDIQNMGAWHYKVVTLDLTDPPAEMEVTLNELGKERWECFHVLPSTDGQTTLFFKKSRRSYLKSIPFKDVMRLLPLMSGGGGGDDDGGQ